MIRALGNWDVHYTRNSEARAKFYLSWIKKYSPILDEITLDIGCGNDLLSNTVKEAGGVAISLDISHRGDTTKPNPDFLIADATKLPIRDGVVKNVFSSDVYEHVSDQDGFLMESLRVMRGDGRGSLTTGNRLFPIDRHTGLPFIDLLPQRIATSWARKAKHRHIYDIYEPSFFGLCRALSNRSSQYTVNFRIFIDFYRSAYPDLPRKGKQWFALIRFLDRIGLLKLITPKFYAVFEKGPHRFYSSSSNYEVKK